MIALYSMGVNRPRLAAPAVVGPFDPGDDGGLSLFAGVLAAAVQHVLLQQAEEALHRGSVAGAPTRPMEPTIVATRAWTNFRLRNRLSRSLCKINPATSPRRPPHC